jgi:predicted nuclease of predicted toxin-antitoxin system
MLAALADEHVKAAIVSGLRRRGMDVLTVQEIGAREADDDALLERAFGDGRLFLSNDTDLLRIHSRWVKEGRPHAGIVFWAQGLPVGDAVRGVLQYALKTTAREAANTVHFL